MSLVIQQPTGGSLQILGASVIGTLDGSGNFVQFGGGNATVPTPFFVTGTAGSPQAQVDLVSNANGSGGTLLYTLSQGTTVVFPASTVLVDKDFISQMNLLVNAYQGIPVPLDLSACGGLDQTSGDGIYDQLASDGLMNGNLNMGAFVPTGGASNASRITLIANGYTITDGA